MAIILNIETATEICSVSLSNENNIIDFRENKEGKSHASLLTIFIEDILKSNKLKIKDLSAISISKGPGSYTGLRIGVSAAKGICYGASVPLIAISTLQILVSGLLKKSPTEINIGDSTLLCPMIDARRLEVYTALFDSKGAIIKDISAEIISETSFQDVLVSKKIIFFGNGSNKCKSILTHKNAYFIDNIYPSAGNMAELSMAQFNMKAFEDTAYFEPFYLKDFVATTPKNKVINN
jgi:tRNA threonylcarbamoyladenosine biosynthesis protein TsaB